MRHALSLSHATSLVLGAGLALLASVGCDGNPPPPVAAARAGCTHNSFYWRENLPAWRHYELRMGETYYAQEEQMDILRTRPNGNGLVALAQEFIAAKLNVDAGASGDGMEQTFTAAEAMIGKRVVPPRGDGFLTPLETMAVTDTLFSFNEGRLGPGTCTTGATTP